jgi:polyhydroxybutyrate depolymerase
VGGGAAPVGTHATKFPWQGTERDVQVTIPSTYDTEHPSPLLLDLHGFGSNGPEEGELTAFPVEGAARGYIVVEPTGDLLVLPPELANAPRGNQFNRHTWWNFLGSQPVRFVASLGVHVTGDDLGADDIGFLTELIATMKRQLCVDSDRVFVAGLSNGAGMTTTLAACEIPDVFAAAGPVAGVNINQGCPDGGTSPMPVLAVHATDDTFIPYSGGHLLGLPSDAVSVPDRMADWARQNGCVATPTYRHENAWVTVTVWTDCTGGRTELWSIDDYKHGWPRANNAEGEGHMDATKVLLDFFDTQHRND